MTRPTRRDYLAGAAAAATALAGCIGSPDGTDTLSGGDEETTPNGDDPDAVPTAEAVLPLPAAGEAIREAAQSGGPSKDGIPSIDDPSFIAPDAVDFLEPGDPVFGVARGEDVKAYPQTILVAHEIVNDTLDGTPVSVTYCPLTGTVQGFERGATEFGVSGRLINNNLVMYDRATDAWWPQMLATSIPGPWNEEPGTHSLREFRLVWTTWERWQEHNPDTTVLSTETGHVRNYGSDPYGSYNPPGGYYENDRLLFSAFREDDRFPPKAVFMGARTPDGAVAFRKDTILAEGVMTGTLAGTSGVAVWDTRYDTAYVYLNPEEVGVERTEGHEVLADGTRYAPDDLPLERVHTFDAMWFAWAGYYPDTNVYA